MIRTAAGGLVLLSAAMWACSASNGTSTDGSGQAGTGGAIGGHSGNGGTGGQGGTTGGRGGNSGGRGGSSSGGAGGIGSGNPCLQPVSPGVYGCAATYDEQLAKSCNPGPGIVTGACGTGWGWRCVNLLWQECVYDAQKNLIAARWCEDVPSCGGASGGESSYCRETTPSVADFGNCIDDIGRDAGRD